MPCLPHPTSTDLLVLHTLRCIGFASPGRVAEATGLSESDVESELIDLAVAGLVTRVPGDFGGWGLTGAGRAADAERVAVELDTAGARAAVATAYDDFLLLNPELLDLCTAWQMRSVGGLAIPNDHADPAHDRRVLDRLTEFHRRADVVCVRLAVALPRFQRYRARLTHALTRAASGASEYVTDDLASYHVVWFQLHEDLLVTLGLPRH
ncbi:transcriptional regulator [Micromonospora sp. NPDC023644]|uniref:transcriptional regulator n=1 Tax=Micromonospora sp. NPDC023644 TaxID=3154321 RepID=UPI0033FD12B6